MAQTSGAAKAKLQTKTSVSDVLTEAVRGRERASAKATEQVSADPRFEAIAANPFYSVMFSESTSPEEKRSAITQLLTFEGTKEENRERIKAFELFKEFLQAQREEMASEIILLTDTGTFSELKQVYDELNTSLIDFDNKMKPLTDIIDAVYTLRTNGMTLEAFQEIIRDRESERKLLAEKQKAKQDFDRMKSDVGNLNREIAALGEDRSFFGLGPVKQAAREDIARKRQSLTEIESGLGDLSNKIAELEKQTPSDSELGEFAAQKKKLRELLDISADEHKQRQKDLVDSAVNFVTNAKERVGSVRSHLGQMNDQVENLFDANNMMGSVYAILNEGIKDAADKNQNVREALQPPTGEEDMIAKMSREQKKMAVEQHITALDASAADTMATYADLTSGAIRIKTMKDAVDQQSARARTMHSQGISGVADRLSVVLQAVSSAALGEASAMAKDTLNQMAENTNKVAQKESIRIAMGIEEQNSELAKAIDDLGAYGEVVRTATSITREGITDMRKKLDELKSLAENVQGDVQDAIAVNADTARGGSTAKPKQTAATPNPFKLKK
jgi:predicted  nucleic acid-binding Zn-ribbon protein